MTIQDNLSTVRARIQSACLQAGRHPGDVALLAVSKTQPASAIQSALAAGQHHFGENYLQEALEKVTTFPEACWHFIGSIQSNKAKVIATHFDYVHSVSSLRVARRLSDSRPQHLHKLKVFLQVNLANEATKSGVLETELEDLVGETARLSQLDLQGLMAIPPASLTDAPLKAYFERIIELQTALESCAGKPLVGSSFGMSKDLETAISAGSTWVRIGTAIFGERAPRTDDSIKRGQPKHPTTEAHQPKETSNYG